MDEIQSKDINVIEVPLIDREVTGLENLQDFGEYLF